MQLRNNTNKRGAGGSYASAIHYNMQDAEIYNLWQAASLPWHARNNFHTLYIHALKNVK